MRKKPTFGELKFLPLLAMLLLFGYSFSAKAADVTISAPTTFDDALAAFDENPATPFILDISGNLTIASGGSITNNDPLSPPNDDAFPVSIIVGGDLDIWGSINTENQHQAGYGGDITLTVRGSFIMKTGALISSSNLQATDGHTRAGYITIDVAEAFTMETGSTIKGNAYKGQGGDILITGSNDISIDGNVLSQSSGSGAGCNPGHGGYISITAVNNLLISDNAVVSSKSGDPGADLVHLASCYITIYGLVESTGSGHAIPTCPVTHLVPPFRPDKPANSTAGVEVWAGKTLIIDNVLPHQGEIKADLCCGGGSNGTSWIDLFAKDDISIVGNSANFAVHANGQAGNTDHTPGFITVKSMNGNITASGNAIQADATAAGSWGGTITVEAANNVNLNDAILFARGDAVTTGGLGKGGNISIRSFNTTITWLNGIGDVNPTGTNSTYLPPANAGVIAFQKCLSGAVDVTGTAFPNVGLPSTTPVTLADACGGVPYLPLEPALLTYVEFPDCERCIQCNGNTIVVDQNVTINFNTNPPTYTGDPDLLPFFSWDKSGGATADKWFAKFDLGKNKLLVTEGAIITVTQVGSGNNKYAPGLYFKCDCHIQMDDPSHIVVESLNKQAGDIIFKINGDIIIDGEVRNEVTGTNGLPGAIYAQSKCGELKLKSKGRFFDLGLDSGGNLISMLTCGEGSVAGDITIDNGLVKAFAHAHANNLDITRPRIKVVSNLGKVTINANTDEPIYDEFSMSGGKYDLWGGLLSWVRDNGKPGMIWVQAAQDVTVMGHGTDPTPPVRQSFGAISAKATASDAPGGSIDVRSLGGRIIADNRAFDVSGKNRLTIGNFAKIKLLATSKISLSRSGNATCNPVVDASAPGAGTYGGVNELQSPFEPEIDVFAEVSASGAVPGENIICQIPRAGHINPAPVCVPIPGVFAMFDCNGDPILPDTKSGTPGIWNNPLPSNGILIYPNPAKELFTMQINNASDQGSILTLQDLTGKEVFRAVLQLHEGVNNYPVSVAGITDGLYILKLQTGTEVRQAKLIVNR